MFKHVTDLSRVTKSELQGVRRVNQPPTPISGDFRDRLTCIFYGRSGEETSESTLPTLSTPYDRKRCINRIRRSIVLLESHQLEECTTERRGCIKFSRSVFEVLKIPNQSLQSVRKRVSKTHFYFIMMVTSKFSSSDVLL